jgi:hypothetical protein
MSYQPGMGIPKFCEMLVFGEGGWIGETYNSDWDCRSIWEYELDFLELRSSAPVLC